MKADFKPLAVQLQPDKSLKIGLPLDSNRSKPNTVADDSDDPDWLQKTVLGSPITTVGSPNANESIPDGHDLPRYKQNRADEQCFSTKVERAALSTFIFFININFAIATATSVTPMVHLRGVD